MFCRTKYNWTSHRYKFRYPVARTNVCPWTQSRIHQNHMFSKIWNHKICKHWLTLISYLIFISLNILFYCVHQHRCFVMDFATLSHVSWAHDTEKNILTNFFHSMKGSLSCHKRELTLRLWSHNILLSLYALHRKKTLTGLENSNFLKFYCLVEKLFLLQTCNFEKYQKTDILMFVCVSNSEKVNTWQTFILRAHKCLSGWGRWLFFNKTLRIFFLSRELLAQKSWH